MTDQSKTKVCVITWYRSGNYGTCLQALALYEALNKMGYETFMLRYGRDYSIRQWDTILKACVKKLRGATKKNVVESKDKKEKMETIDAYVKKTYQFVSIKGKDNSRKTIEAMDAFVVGSDQLWNPDHVQDTFLLDFVPDNKIKLSYATSVGVTDLPLFTKRKYKRYISRFQKISVREQTGAELISKITGRKVDTVIDPTLLLNDKEWDEIAGRYNDKGLFQSDYLLTYFVGDNINHWDDVLKIAEYLRLKVIDISMTETQVPLSVEPVCNAGPADFIRAIQNASYVCTDSFHATAFSLNFHRQFSVFPRFISGDRKSQNSRLTDFLGMLGLENRFYDSGTNAFCANDIDYSSVDKILLEKREESYAYLREALKRTD